MPPRPNHPVAGKSTILNPNHLLDAADHLVSERRPGAPRQVNLRRAVSTVYYALFHWLAGCAADSLVGAAETPGESWTRVYRALNHRDVRQRCHKGGVPPSTPYPLRQLGTALVELQRIRNGADYNPVVRLARKDVLARVDEARRILEDLERATPADRRAFTVHVLFKERRD